MLDAFDSAREKARSHEVETFHGRVAEAKLREWLSSFLPKRYGVTSGYIVSTTFSCGLVFFEMRTEQQFSESALGKLVAGLQLRGFFGGVILRGEGHTSAVTARLSLTQSQTPIESTIGVTKQSLLSGFGMTESIRITDGLHLGAMLMWAEPYFSQFGFDLISMMQGMYEIGRLSSFYGMGTSEHT